jgi:hypothetical protein
MTTTSWLKAYRGRDLTPKFSAWATGNVAPADRSSPTQNGNPTFRFRARLSMGGLVVAQFARRLCDVSLIQVAGLVLSSPCLALDPKTANPFMITLAKVFGTLMPTLALDPLDPSLISRNPDAVARYAKDPLIGHGGVLARTGQQIVGAVTEITGGSGGSLADGRGSMVTGSDLTWLIWLLCRLSLSGYGCDCDCGCGCGSGPCIFCGP